LGKKKKEIYKNPQLLLIVHFLCLPKENEAAVFYAAKERVAVHLASGSPSQLVKNGRFGKSFHSAESFNRSLWRCSAA